jgi:hypothetical protein
MIIELRLPDDSMFRMIVANSSAQELESVLCKMTGLSAVSTYNHYTKEISGWKEGKQVEACFILGRWKLYDMPDAK